jgi:hypothetical protein
VTADIINLRRVKKQKSRSDAEQNAETNRQKFGQSKAEKAVARIKQSREAKELDGHKRDK